MKKISIFLIIAVILVAVLYLIFNKQEQELTPEGEEEGTVIEEEINVNKEGDVEENELIIEEENNTETEEEEMVACTMDAKLCPDGSYVGRIPPDCEFAPCPGEEGFEETNVLDEDFDVEEAEMIELIVE